MNTFPCFRNNYLFNQEFHMKAKQSSDRSNFTIETLKKMDNLVLYKLYHLPHKHGFEGPLINFLPNNKILDQYKGLADDKINATKKLKFVL